MFEDSYCSVVFVTRKQGPKKSVLNVVNSTLADCIPKMDKIVPSIQCLIISNSSICFNCIRIVFFKMLCEQTPVWASQGQNICEHRHLGHHGSQDPVRKACEVNAFSTSSSVHKNPLLGSNIAMLRNAHYAKIKYWKYHPGEISEPICCICSENSDRSTHTFFAY